MTALRLWRTAVMCRSLRMPDVCVPLMRGGLLQRDVSECAWKTFSPPTLAQHAVSTNGVVHTVPCEGVLPESLATGPPGKTVIQVVQLVTGRRGLASTVFGRQSLATVANPFSPPCAGICSYGPQRLGSACSSALSRH